MESSEIGSQIKKTELGLFPSDWKVTELQKLTTYITDGKHGDCENQTNSGYFFLSSKDVINGQLNYANTRQITKSDFEEVDRRTSLQGGDILLCTTGASIGRIGIVKPNEKVRKTTFQKSVAIVKPNRLLLDSYFLYYYFLVNNRRVIETAGGTTQQNLLLKDLRAFKIAAPLLQIQQKQISPLKVVDAKIELNQRMNQTLEAIGAALFKCWFFDFEFPNKEGKPYKSSGGEMGNSKLGEIPNHWRTGKLNQIATLLMGISPEGTTYNYNGKGIPLLNGAADFHEQVILPRKWTTNPIKVCAEGSLIFCIRATIGNAVFADKEYCLGRGVAALNPKNAAFMEFIYYVLKESFDELISKASGSVILGLSKTDIEELPIIIPDDQTVSRFHEICSALFSKIVNQGQNSITLASIRDCLLPKLMSGKIRVSNYDKVESQ